jgi:hypothetical protein
MTSERRRQRTICAIARMLREEAGLCSALADEKVREAWAWVEFAEMLEAMEPVAPRATLPAQR